MKNKFTKGTIILETSIVLPIFMFLILFIYGFFRITLAQNMITHTLLQSAKSMSWDSYLTQHVESVAETESKAIWNSLGSGILDFARLVNSKYYTSASDWYAVDASGAAKKADEVTSTAYNRFVGYMAGRDPTAASEKLKALGVVNGLSGIDFSTTLQKEVLTVEISYELQFWFDAFGAGKIPQKQSVTVRLWK